MEIIYNFFTEKLESEKKGEKTLKEKREAQKKKLKEMFNREYDEKDETYFDELKKEFSEQAQVCNVNYR